MKTYSPKPRDIERRWYVLDASGAILGRLATQAASILRGKHKPIFAPHADTGDHVIVINAKEVTLSGGKENKKIAYHHSGYPGGLTETVYSRLLAKKPAFAVEKAIKGMLPHNRLGRQMASKLRVYAGADHRHEAQKPQALAAGRVPHLERTPRRDPPRAGGCPEGPACAEGPDHEAEHRQAHDGEGPDGDVARQEDHGQALDGQDHRQAHDGEGHDRQDHDGEVAGQEDDRQAFEEEGDLAWCRPRRDDARRPWPGSDWFPAPAASS